MTANIFVLGLNDFNRHRLRSLRNYHDCTFHQLIEKRDLNNVSEFPIDALIDRAIAQMRSFSGRVDGVIGYMDFPVSTMLPVLQQSLGLRGATLESVLKCEHKYWARSEQSRVVPEHIPRFHAFDPFDDDSIASIPLDYPYWIKPIKSCGAFLGFRIQSARHLRRAIPIIREHIGRFGEPFEYLLDLADIPDEIARVRGNYCLAEEIIGGRQCTVEGYAFEGEPHVYGVVDSIRDRNRSTFTRYEYPSSLPRSVQARMAEIAGRLMRYIGYDNAAFNMEFFWSERHDRTWLIETNPRIAQAHCDLFEKVDGQSSHQVAVDLALGQRPRMRRREGAFKRAAYFFVRAYRDGIVTHVPSEAEVRWIEEQFPGTHIELCVQEGDRLSQLIDHQDSYSYELAFVYMGARNHRQLLERFNRCAMLLPFAIVDAESAPVGVVAGEKQMAEAS